MFICYDLDHKSIKEYIEKTLYSEFDDQSKTR